MPVWYHTLGILDVLYGNGILWRSSFFGASPNGLCSLDFSTTMGVLKVCDLCYPHAPVCILFLYVVEA